jgi:hypothetical protein
MCIRDSGIWKVGLRLFRVALLGFLTAEAAWSAHMWLVGSSGLQEPLAPGTDAALLQLPSQ